MTKICVEITCGKICTLLDIIQLPMCPSYYEINVPYSISELEIKGPWYSPRLQIIWPNFTVKNIINDKMIHINSEIHLNIFQAIRLRNILAKPYFVYVYQQHYGVMIPIRQT